MRSLAFLLALGALGGGLVWNQQRLSPHEQALAAVAGEIAGRGVTVHCQGFPSELLDVGWTAGEVHFDAAGRPADETRLDRSACKGLARLRDALREPQFRCVLELRPCPPDVGRVASAPHLLAHEAWHLRGEVDEARTECYALQTTALVAERLGVSTTDARSLAAWTAVHVYPTLPERYRTPHCRNGGPLDLNRASLAWP